MQPYDTIIVGLGASGCAAVSKLGPAGKRVLVLEAQNRVGGRVKTVQFGNGVVEVGAEWIHGTNNSVTYELALKNNVSVLAQGLEFGVYRSDGTPANKDLVNELVTLALEVQEYPPPDPEPLGQFITRKLMEHIREKHPKVLEDQEFIDEFFQFLDQVVDNYEASNSWNDITTASKYQDLGGDQHTSWHRHGYYTLFEILLNTFNDGPGYPNVNIKFETEVTNIQWPQDPVEKVKVTTKDGAVYTADNVIVTVSLGVLKEKHTTLFTPVLPQIKQTAIEKITIGVVSKIILSFDTVWWSNHSYLAFIWKTNDRREAEVNGSWLTHVEGITMSMGSNNSIALWNNGNSAIMTPITIHARTTHRQNNSHREDIYGYHTLFTPHLPIQKSLAIENVSMGTIGKIILSFDNLLWDKRCMFAVFLWNGEDKRRIQRSNSWITRVFGVSSPAGSDNTLTLWTSGDVAKEVETLPEEEVKTKAMAVLRRFLGKTMTIPEPTGMIRSMWHSNPFTRGSYTYDNILTPQYPNARLDLGSPLLDSAGKPRVLFAGEATNEHHFSTVHGAVETGYREAMRLLPGGSKI